MPEDPKDEAQTLQEDLASLIAKGVGLAGVPVLTERLKDVESEIERALGGLTATDSKAGLCVIVVTPQVKASKPNLPGPYFDQCAIVARVVERVAVNTGPGGTGIAAWTAARSVAKALHHKRTSDTKPIIVTDIRLVADPDSLIYDVIGRTELGMQ